MNLLKDLLDLRLLDPSDPSVEFSFARPLPAWAWLLVGLGAVGISAWGYWKLEGSGKVRALLAGVRALLLVLLALVASGPRLTRANERVEPDWLVALVDRSASMTIRDAGVGGARSTRESQVIESIRASRETWRALARGRNLLWMGFDAGAFELRSTFDAEGGFEGVDLGEPDGRRTSLGEALDRALARTAARPVSGIVVFSDGRSIDEASRGALRRLESERIPLIVVPLGSATPVADVGVASVEAPTLAFVNDSVPVLVGLERTGAHAGGGGVTRVELIEALTGRVLDEREIDDDDPLWREGADGGEATVSLASRPTDPGSVAWRVRVSRAGGGEDLVESNNEGEARIELVDRPLRVAYLDGYPRWEQRFIKNLLVRERSIESAVMMVSGRHSFLKEGSHPLETIPNSPEEWARFDVVVLGDFRAELLTTEQMAQLKEHVALRGAGLLWVAGPGATPQSWHATELADLLPFRSSAEPPPRHAEAVTMSPGPAAERLGLLRLGDPPDEDWPSHLSDPRVPWSRLQWAQRIDPERLKPTAEVLASVTPASAWRAEGDHASGTPAVISMRYGAGRVLYVATDEIWRWRYARGEALPERFWLPLLRLMGRESLAQGGVPAVIGVEPRRASVGQPIRIEVRILDQTIADASPRSIGVRIERTDDPDGFDSPVELALAPESGEGRSRSSVRTYASAWAALAAGRYRARVTESVLAGAGLASAFEVVLPDDEIRRADANHELLADLAERTGGRVLPASDLSDLPTLLPRREVRIQGEPVVETLWDKGIVFALLIGLAALEWVGRRLIRLA